MQKLKEIPTGDALVFMTAPQEIMLFRGKALDACETDQMRARVRYLQLSHAFVGNARVELKSCGLCGARLYLEGFKDTAQDRGVTFL